MVILSVKTAFWGSNAPLFLSLLALTLLSYPIARWVKKRLAKMYDERIEAFQRDLLSTHSKEVESIYRQMRSWKHDWKNQLQTMEAFVLLGQPEDLLPYLKELNTGLDRVDSLVKSGNLMLDAILNAKLTLAKEQGIPYDVRVSVPRPLFVREVDLCSLVGNLLNNALEASQAAPSPEEALIRVYMAPLKHQLYLCVTNKTFVAYREEHGRLITTKPGADHGFGLASIDTIAEKYDGFVNRQYEEGIFATEVFLSPPEEPHTVNKESINRSGRD
ncbi:hypothetical protein ABB02_01550 [Clostridiaceae bacterium JG1575]|nr:hypothetical protein ABB02_01550 [Clostridiaceae bacterium JG1575]